MKFKKLKNIIISSVTVVALFSSNVYYASALETNAENGNVSENSENVLNVNVDDNGALSYNLNDSKTSNEKNKFSWDNASVYFAMTDRFSNGDTSNDHSYGRSVGEADADNYQNRQGTFHGGDLKGLTNKVNDGYFDDLGINAIWITAPYEQIHGALCSGGFKHYAYHGYYTLDYTNVDANMGTAKDLENFIDTAHSHGIRVVFDVVMNHAGYADAVTANEYGFGGLSSNWKDIYYNWNESQYDWYNDYAGEAASQGSTGMMEPNADWVTNWWGPNWIRAIGNRFKGYEGSESGDEKTMCLSGLPDFKVENKSSVSLPGILKTKWAREGRLDEETKELDNYFNSTGKTRNVSNYLVKWLTDWVREYGVDGFRCDTAKHVDMSCWKDLKDEAKSALKEWRANNPGKPGSNWTDDFWMTGEHFDHGVYKDNYFTSGAFDSMINFSYMSQAFTSSAAIDNIFSDYANKINSDSSFNVLSYISSHDKGLSRGNMITAGNNLLLLPGGIQIFYGDETNRQAVGSNKEQSWRSEMNWDSKDTNELQHWQKLGQFRNRHIAIGAGTHKKISSSPYTFSREYNKNGISDKVVVALTDTAGSKTISVKGAFNNGDRLVDFYTGTEYTVENNSVQVEAGTNGVVLLECKVPAAAVSLDAPVNSENGYYSDSLTVTLNTVNCTTSKYSVDEGEYVNYSNGDKIEIKDKNVGDKTTVKVVGFDADGKEVSSAEQTYTKIPVPDGITIHVKNSSWTEAPNVYIYDEKDGKVTEYTGSWPGTKMTDEGNGWYTFDTKDVVSGKVIFNGSWGQYPASQQPGIDMTGEVWMLDGKIIDKPEFKTIDVKYVDKSTGEEIADSTTVNGIVGQSYTTSAKLIKGYKLSETPSNASGTVSKDAITVTYEYNVSEGLTVHVKNSKFNGTPNIYVYNEENGKVTQYTGSWPGVKMTDEGNGWYSYTNSDVESAKVIFNGSWGQYPASGMPGMDSNGEVWILDNMFVNPDLAK